MILFTAQGMRRRRRQGVSSLPPHPPDDSPFVVPTSLLLTAGGSHLRVRASSATTASTPRPAMPRPLNVDGERAQISCSKTGREKENSGQAIIVQVNSFSGEAIVYKSGR